jgi:HlyD family secretion protein
VLVLGVSFGGQAANAIRVPEAAFQTNRKRGERQGGGGGNAPNREQQPQKAGTLYVVQGSGQQAKVATRNVTLGQRQDGLVTVVAGLSEGDRIVIRSNKPLKNGDAVKLSILSEPSNPARRAKQS